MLRRLVLYGSIAAVAVFVVLGLVAIVFTTSDGSGGAPVGTTSPPPLTTIVSTTDPAPVFTSGPGKALEAIAGMKEEIENNLAQGGLAFNHPNRMGLRETKTIQLVIESGVSGAEVAPRVTEPGIVIPADIEVAATMQAFLVGRGFDISALTPETQPFGGHAEWRWQITAIDSGRLELALTVNALIDLTEDGVPLPTDIFNVEVFERTIDVQVGVLPRVSGFLRANFFWLGPLLLVPLAGIGWDRVRRRLK